MQALDSTPEVPLTENRSRPPWGITDLLLVVASFFVATFVTGLLAYAAVRSTPHFRGMTSKAAFKDPLLLVPMEFGSYLLAFLFTRMWITLRAMEDFWMAIQWCWPGGVEALSMIFSGALMAIVLQAASYFLPIPKGLPMERYFHEPAFAWLMLVFGVAVAPIVEEMFFRGLLFPVMERWGKTFAIISTAFLFALLHQAQLAHAWAPLAVLFVVGLALTITRANTGSVASSWLMHVGYNGSLFALMLVATRGFTNMAPLGGR